MNWKKLELVFAVLVGITACAFAVVLYLIVQLPEHEFVQKFSVGEQAYTQLESFEEARESLAADEQLILSAQVHWTSERGELTATLGDMGFALQTQEIYQVFDSFMEEAPAKTKLKTYLFGQSFDLHLSVDNAALKTAFAETGIEQGMKNANFVYEDGNLLIDAERVGYGIDEAAILSEVQTLFEENLEWRSGHDALVTMELPLRSSQPEVTSSDLEPHREQATVLLGYEFTATDEYGDTWTLALSEHMQWLLPDENETLALQPDAVAASVAAEIAPHVEVDAQSASLSTDEDGNYVFEGSARFGRQIDTEAFFTDLQAQFAARDEADSDSPIVLSILETEPELTISAELQELGITELLGFGHSDFSGSPYNRVYNVNYGMDIFNGTLLLPDEEFSFTSLMGPIDGAHGWKEELVILGDETVPEYGGGLCQVSSTMYRAALYLGLPITERRNHSYAVSYYAYPYGYGLDATVYSNKPDMRFLNDTGNAILVQGYTEGSTAYFVFYGTDDGREVQMTGPVSYNYRSIAEPQITYTEELEPGERVLDDYAHTGFDVDWWRTVTYPVGHALYPEGHSVEEVIHSSYQARPTKYLEGTPLEEREST